MTATTVRAGFEIVAIDTARLTNIRTSGQDEHGNSFTCESAGGWEPLRCCLRRAQAQEPIALICFSPWTEPSPWLEAGPVFVHFERCAGYTTPNEYPPDLAESPSMFNTFYADGSRAYEHIRFVEPGENHTAVLGDVLAHPDVDHLHVRSSQAGCFTFAVQRPPASEIQRAKR